MNEIKPNEKKKLTQEILTSQIAEFKRQIEAARQQIAVLQQHVDRQSGALNYAEYILSQFDLPSIPEKTKFEIG